MRLAAHSVNQQPPPGSATIACGRAPRSGSGNSSIEPSGVIRPIYPALISTNQRARSVPAVMPTGPAPVVGRR